MATNAAKLALIALLCAPVPALAGAAPPQPPAAPAPAAPPAPGAPPAQAFSINENIGDWVVRCIEEAVKSPAPCEVIQNTINRDNQQRLSSFSIAFIPSRNSYAMQIVVPTGVSLAKGLELGTTMTGARFNRCERDGCYVETLVDATAITSLSNTGASTTLGVVGYGANNEIKLPVSLTGFTQAMDRMKVLSRQRAIALPANDSVLPGGGAPPRAAAPPARPPAAR